MYRLVEALDLSFFVFNNKSGSWALMIQVFPRVCFFYTELPEMRMLYGYTIRTSEQKKQKQNQPCRDSTML